MLLIYNIRQWKQTQTSLPILCNTYGIKHKPTNVKNPQANAILERIHAVLRNMLRTSKLDMAKSVKASGIDVFLSDAAWAVCSTYHIVLKASPGAAKFGRDMLFDIPFIELTGKRLENIGNDLLILTTPVKTKAGLIMITRLVRKC
jgi:hypothetical protein